MARHTACDRMNAKAHIDTLVTQITGDVVDRMLRLRNGHTISRNDDHASGVTQQFCCLDRAHRNHFANRFSVSCGFYDRAARRAEAPGDYADEIAIHRLTHDVGENRATGTN